MTRALRPPQPPVNSLGMGALLTLRARQDPDRPAITIGGQTLTRRELELRSNRRAHALQALGVARDDIVAIALPTGFAFHETTFAAWKIGATPGSISHRLATAETDAILELMQPRAVIGLSPPPGVGAIALSHDWAPDPGAPADPPAEPIGTYWKAMTSGGSTGRPKVIIHHSPPTLDAETPSQGLVLDDTVLIPAPLYHNAPFSLSHMALCWGAHVIEMERFDPEEVLRLIERHRVRWLYLVPTMMHRIWGLPADVRGRYDLSSLEFVVHMAAPCAPWLKEAWIEWIGPDKIWELYAGTESLGGTVISGREWLAHRGSVGRCYIGSLKILDSAGEPCPPGEVGDIFFKPPGDRPPFHYLGADAVVKDGWQTYGDLGWLDADGYLYLADRRTDMVISGGANIYPAEVEAALDAHPSIASSVCIGLPDPDLGHRLHAIIEVRPGPVPAAADLEAFLTSRLARYKIPYSFEIAVEPLRDEAGKVRRSALRDLRAAQIAAGARYPALRSTTRTAD